MIASTTTHCRNASLHPLEQEARPGGMCSVWTLILVLVALGTSGCTTLSDSAANRGKVIVVTGASSGLGRGVALKLAEQGASVVLAARRTAVLEEVARECRSRGGQAEVVTADVGREADVRRLAEAAVARFGRIDVWINNAGVGAMGRFEEIPLADQKRLLEVNVDGVLYGSYYAMQQFRRQRAGTLINISSIDGKIGYAYHATYSASKHAVRGLGAALHQELRLNGENNIKVCTIFPYATDTPWWDHAANYTGHSPRMVLMDPPEPVVDTIVRATVRPKKEIAPGYKAKVVLASQRLSPRLTERFSGSLAHREFYVVPPPAPNGPGTLFEPMQSGTGVDGGVRARIEAENARMKR